MIIHKKHLQQIAEKLAYSIIENEYEDVSDPERLTEIILKKLIEIYNIDLTS